MTQETSVLEMFRALNSPKRKHLQDWLVTLAHPLGWLLIFFVRKWGPAMVGKMMGAVGIKLLGTVSYFQTNYRMEVS